METRAKPEIKMSRKSDHPAASHKKPASGETQDPDLCVLCASASLRLSSGAGERKKVETPSRERRRLFLLEASRLCLIHVTPTPKKSSKNNQLYFTPSVRSRLEKCSSCDTFLCVENSSISRASEVVLLPHGLERSSTIAARPCAFLRAVKITAPALPFSVSCLVFSVFPEHPVRKIPKSKNPAIPPDISEKYPVVSSGHLVRKFLFPNTGNSRKIG